MKCTYSSGCKRGCTIACEAKKIYQPSNGTEGMGFIGCFCENCIHEKFSHTYNDADKKCDILSRSMLYSPNEKEYPKEWAYDSLGHPTCTSFVNWDWGNDGDPDDPENPKAPIPPPPPNQLNLFPLYPNETTYQSHEHPIHIHI